MQIPPLRSKLPQPTSADAEPRVAVVIPIFNKLSLTLRFLESFKSVEYQNYKLIIVDDASTDGSAQAIRQQHPEVTVLDGAGDLWWAGGTNMGVVHALQQNFDYVLTINNDTRVAPDFLTRLVETAQQRPRCIVGSLIKQLEEPDRVWAAGGYVDWANNLLFQLWHQDVSAKELVAQIENPLQVDILTGCGTLIPAACFREIGLYDAVWCPQYHADSELVLRARAAGYEAIVELQAVVYNDVENTSRLDNIYSRRSPMFWRPFYRVHSRYSPKKLAGLRFIATTLIQRHIAPAVKRVLSPFWRATSFLRMPFIKRFDTHIGKLLAIHLYCHSEREKRIAEESASLILEEIRELREAMGLLIHSSRGTASGSKEAGLISETRDSEGSVEAFVHPFRKPIVNTANEGQISKSVG
jgi:GT2 family glycosyltransferase